MAIKATFRAGEKTCTTESLTQWDYGQTLEIESADLPSVFEVHFACVGMKEAIARPCTCLDGVGTVRIPDDCLEQTTNITAWVYEIYNGTGHTIKTITIPITARIRPRPGTEQDMAPDVVDKYTELITEVEELIASLRGGDITAQEATHASRADYANSAGNAGTASRSETAVRATAAVSASVASAARLVDAAHTSGYSDFSATIDGVSVDEGLTLCVRFNTAGVYDPDGYYPSLNVNKTGAFPVLDGVHQQAGPWWNEGDILRLCFRGTYWQVLENVTQGVSYVNPIYGGFRTANDDSYIDIGTDAHRVELYFFFKETTFGGAHNQSVGGIFTLDPYTEALRDHTTGRGFFGEARGRISYSEGEGWFVKGAYDTFNNALGYPVEYDSISVYYRVLD